MDIHAAYQAFQDFLVQYWPILLSYTGISTTVVVVVQLVKRRFKIDQRTVRLIKVIKLDGPKLASILYTLGVSLATGYTWIIDPVNARYIPDRFAFILTAGYFVHRFMVSPTGLQMEQRLLPWWRALVQFKKQQDSQKNPLPSPSVVQPTNVTYSTSGAPGTVSSTVPFNPANQQNQGQ